MDNTDNRLLTGIIEQAEISAEKAIANAQQQASQILSDASSRSKREVAIEIREREAKLQQIQFKLQANLASAKRKAALKQMDEGYDEVMRRLIAKLDAKTISSHLASWIAEAAIGLDLKQAKVAFDPKCPVTEELLAQAAKLVEQSTGSTVELSLDPKPIRGYGVVLSSLDDKVSFNNQVEIRLRRFDRVIRTMIQDHT